MALLLAVAAIALAPSGAALASGVSGVPDEPDALRVAGPSYAALAADLDGDGQQELVRLTAIGRDTNQLAVDIWHLTGKGVWGSTGPAAPMAVASDKGEMARALVSDTSRLLVWHQGRRERVLAVVNSSTPLGDATPCCLTIWEVDLPSPGESPSLKLLIDTRRGGDAVYAVDMDGDGTDELAARIPAGGSSPAAFSVLHWNGSRFDVVTQPLNAGDGAQPFLLGNSDGRPGDEIGLIGNFGGDGQAYGLTRVSLQDTEIRAETSELPWAGVVLPVAPPSGSGPGLILMGEVDRVALAFSWPAGGDMMQVGASSRHGRPVGVIGSGQGTRVMLLRASPPALDLIAPDLSDASVREVRPTDAAKPFFSSTHPPYAGPWSGSGDAPPAQVYGGTLIRATDDGHPALAAMAVLPGMVPVGELGPAGAWTALAQRTSLPASATDVAAAGGALLANNLLILTIARTRDVLSPETGGGELRPSVEGALVSLVPAGDAADPPAVDLHA